MRDERGEAFREKLIILYALDRLGKCTETQLLRFILEFSLVEEFQFFVALGDMKEAGMIEELNELEGKLLAITDEGRTSLQMFSRDVKYTARKKIDENASPWKRRIRDELQMPADWERKDTEYIVHLKLLEAGEAIFNLSLITPGKDQAINFCDQWPKQASFLYRTIVETLGEKRSDEEENREHEKSSDR